MIVNRIWFGYGFLFGQNKQFKDVHGLESSDGGFYHFLTFYKQNNQSINQDTNLQINDLWRY